MDQLDKLYLWPFMQDWKYSVEISGFSSFSSSSCSELDSFFLFQILAIPAIPLTMSAGLLFGTLIGTIIVSISVTIGGGKQKVSGMAIDKAIEGNGFRVVTLLRPSLCFHFLYGLTSVKFIPWLTAQGLGALVPARGGGRSHHAPCCCGHGVHTTHVVELMCACLSRVVCLRHAQGRAMVPPWCGQGFSWWLPPLSHLPPLKSNTGRFHCFLRRHQYVRTRSPSGAHAMHVWSARDAHLAHPTVRVWLAHGARVACVWLAHDLLTWLLEFEPPNLQDFLLSS
ncbi:hypothetical protein CK203_059900 [Vitis vinifera]|uniref:Uncharacterized protein n=1 Tax=Vitis vinifera TaxID=29760 RepID=A0A438GNU9_VITVI|nr:hypothetical protein CK203_059900 [Vitis vinifera]